MSQDSFSFAEGEETPYLEESSDNRRAALVAGGVAAALVVAAGGYFLLGGGGSDTTDSAFVPSHRLRPAVTAPKKVVKPANKLPAPYKATLGRDPFKALYVVPVAAPVAAAPTTTTVAPPTTTTAGTGTAGTGTAGTGTAGTSTAGTGTAGTSGTGTTTPTSTRYTLKLVSISKPSPEVRFTTWKVGADSKTVIPSQRFGKYGEIVVLAFGKNAKGEVDKAIIQVGDDSPMDVTMGESVSVL